MNASAIPPGRQREQDLTDRLAELQAATEDLRAALPFVNDATLHTHAEALATGAARLVAAHREGPGHGPDLANDLAGLMSAVRALRVPSQDDELGRTPTLLCLRSAIGLIAMALGDALDAAQALGLNPSQSPLPQELPVELPRAGNEELLNGIARRLDAVVRKLDALDKAKAAPTDFPQQTGLLEYYVGAMRLEIDLAKLHLTIASETSDFGALARAVEVMTELTGDFVATVRAWVGRVSDTVAQLAEGARKEVRRVAAGTRTALAWVVRRTYRLRAAQTAREQPFDSSRLDDKISALHRKLERLSRDREPQEWAAAENELADALQELGEQKVRAARLQEALDAFRAALALRAGLAAHDPDNGEWQRQVSISHTSLGDVMKAQGDLASAREEFRVAMNISASLAARDPENAQWQQTLGMSQDRLGEVMLWQGDVSGASDAFRAAMEIAAHHTARAPDSADWQYHLGVSQGKLGDLMRAVGNVAGALGAYRSRMDIAARLAARDPDNTEWQRNLSISHNRLGGAMQVQGDLAGALAAFRAGMDIAARLAARDPDNAQWQRDLSISHTKLGEVMQAQGDLAGARESFRADMDIAARLAARDPDNADWQRDLFVAVWRLADIHAAMGETTPAREFAARALAQAQALVRRYPDFAEHAKDMRVAEELHRRICGPAPD